MSTQAKVRMEPRLVRGIGGEARIRAVIEVNAERSCALLVLVDLLDSDQPSFPAGLPPAMVEAAKSGWNSYLGVGGLERLSSLRRDAMHAV
jgi:hypothetical protein